MTQKDSSQKPHPITNQLMNTTSFPSTDMINCLYRSINARQMFLVEIMLNGCGPPPSAICVQCAKYVIMT